MERLRETYEKLLSKMEEAKNRKAGWKNEHMRRIRKFLNQMIFELDVNGEVKDNQLSDPDHPSFMFILRDTSLRNTSSNGNPGNQETSSYIHFGIDFRGFMNITYFIPSFICGRPNGYERKLEPIPPEEFDYREIKNLFITFFEEISTHFQVHHMEKGEYKV